MFLVLWEFEVKPSSLDRFEKIYSAGGDWELLFRRDANYQGSRLLRDTSRPQVYVTIDSWVSLSAYETFLATHAAEYHALDTSCNGICENERYLGSFETSEH